VLERENPTFNPNSKEKATLCNLQIVLKQAGLTKTISKTGNMERLSEL
jgi:hypothetical protein